jgi:outer membrane protein OmpA-like peptidoglycan-associated protein
VLPGERTPRRSPIALSHYPTIAIRMSEQAITQGRAARRQAVTSVRAAILALGAALLLGGCANTPPPGPPTPEQRTGAAEALVVERQWLDSWLGGTPVRIAQRPNGAIDVDVPREFCFDAGSSVVKPALAAVLDKLAESLRRVPLARVPLIAAPADAVTAPSLALQRAQQVRDGLRARGVAEGRLGSPAVAAAASVHLRVTAASP